MQGPGLSIIKLDVILWALQHSLTWTMNDVPRSSKWNSLHITFSIVNTYPHTHTHTHTPGGGRPLGSGRQLPPQLTDGRRPLGGGGGGALEGGSRGESLHCALLLDYVPPEEPPSTPLGNALRIR